MFPRVDLGHGIGLRPRHYGEFLSMQPKVDWVEAMAIQLAEIRTLPEAFQTRR